MDFSLIFPPLLSFIGTLLGVQLMRRFFPKLGLMDRPHEYGLTRRPIPYSGGVIFFCLVALAAIFFLEMSPTILAVLIAGGLITLVSFIDDRIRLSPWIRLAVQLLAGVIVVFAGVKIQLINAPFIGPVFLDTFSFTIAGHEIWLLSGIAIIVWLGLMMNVMNWLDGIPGLSSGISTIAQLALFILATRQFHIVDQSAVITLASVLAASTAAFIFFDFYPPKILMGDAGSMFLGFMLGVLSIIAGGKLATALLIMGFPVVDAIFVVVRRLIRGRSPLRGDYSHFHHRLLRVGFHERSALFLNYALCLASAGIAIYLGSPVAKFFAFLCLIIIMSSIDIILFFRERS